MNVRILPATFKPPPRHAVILLPVGLEERGFVVDGFFFWPAGQGVVHEGFAHGAGGEVFDVFPAQCNALFVAVRGVDAVARAVGKVAFAGGARQSNAHQPFAGGEDDAAVLVVPSIGFVLAHDGELHAVDGEQFVQRHAQCLRHQHINFHERLAAVVIGAQGAIALPFRCEFGEKILRQYFHAGVIAVRRDAPLLLFEIGIPAGLPEISE